MHTKKRLTATLGAFVLIAGLTSPALAQLDSRINQSNTSVHQPDSTENPLNFANQLGTSAIQLAVLKDINHDLVAGSLTPEEASNLKAELNKLNDEESGYQSLGHQIPASVVAKNTAELNKMSSRLHRVPKLSTSGNNALHGDVDDMISRALAENKITSNEAEKYYLRLAQIESNMESAKTDKASGRYDSVEMNSSLAELRAELSRHK